MLTWYLFCFYMGIQQLQIVVFADVMQNLPLTYTRSQFTYQHSLASQQALNSFKTYTHGIGDKNACVKKCMQMLSICVLKHNNLHTSSIRTQATNPNHISYMKQSVLQFNSSGYNVITTKYTTSNFLCSSPNPNSNPNTANYTIYQKHCHNLYLKSYPKQFNEHLGVCTYTCISSNNFFFIVLLHTIVRSTQGIFVNLQLKTIDVPLKACNWG